MADKESTVLLRYTTDEASLRKTEQSSKKLFGILSTPKWVQSLRSTNKQVDKLKENLEDVGEEAEKARRKLGNMHQERFDAVSRDVALAGDVQSNLGALSGLAGAAGAGGLGQGIGVAGELVALTEELPRLKEALKGMPAVFSAAASALGTSSMGLLGAMGGVAVIAAGAAFALGEYNKIQQRVKESTEALIETELRRIQSTADIRQLLGQGDRDAALGLLKNMFDTEQNLLLQRQELMPTLIAAEEEYNRQRELSRDQEGFASDAYRQAASNFNGLTSTMADLDKQLSDNRVTIEDGAAALGIADTSMGGLADALKDVTDASKALTDAEKERVAAINEQAATARRNILQEQQFMGMSTDALNQRVQQLQNEITANQAAADVLRQGGQDASQYEQAIADLNRQIEFIKTTATPAARAVEALAKAEERRTKAAEEAKRIQEDIKNLDTQAREQSQKIAEDYAKRQVDLAKKQAQGELDAQKDLQRRLTDAQTDLARDQANAVLEAQRDTFQTQLDFQRGEAEAARRHADTLEDIQRQAQRDERRNILDRNFKAIFEQRTQTRERIQDEQRGFSRERREAIQAFKEQADDRSRAFADERADRLLQYEQARSDIQLDNQRRLSDLRENLMQERLELQAAYVAQLTDLKAFLAAETMAKKLALQQQFSLTKGGSKTTPLTKGNNQPLPKVSSVSNQSNQQSVSVTINESGNPQKTLKVVKQAMIA